MDKLGKHVIDSFLKMSEEVILNSVRTKGSR